MMPPGRLGADAGRAVGYPLQRRLGSVMDRCSRPDQTDSLALPLDSVRPAAGWRVPPARELGVPTPACGAGLAVCLAISLIDSDRSRHGRRRTPLSCRRPVGGLHGADSTPDMTGSWRRIDACFSALEWARPLFIVGLALPYCDASLSPRSDARSESAPGKAWFALRQEGVSALREIGCREQ